MTPFKEEAGAPVSARADAGRFTEDIYDFFLIS
jgi:hypothetical protein